MFDTGLRRGEILGEEGPGRVEHLLEGNVDVDGQDARGVILGVVEAAEVVVAQVETVLQFGLGVRGIGIQTHGGVHHLGVVLAGLLALHVLFQTGQAAERVDDDLARIGVRTQV